MASLKMSAEGFQILERARRQKGWDKAAEVLYKVSNKLGYLNYYKGNYSNPKSFVNFLLPPLGQGRVGVG